MTLPVRVVRVEEARRRFGDRIDRLAPWLFAEDPLGDAAAAALARDGWQAFEGALAGRAAAEPVRALLDSVGSTPAWVDRARFERAGRLFFRTGVFGGIVLGARSLLSGYCAPAGNKPLVMTGTLQGAGERRLAETGRFVAAVHDDGGMEPGAEGWRISLRVRLMHAHVRRLLHESGRWQAAWGAPLNQHDLLATSLLFSVVWVQGVRRFGVDVRRDEAEDHLHLWRWISEVMGVEPSLLPSTEPDATALYELIRLTQGPPDDDARLLARALLYPARPQGPVGLGEGFCRALLDPELADGLHIPRTPWRHSVRAAAVVVRPIDQARRWSRRVEDRLVEEGRRYWEAAVANGMGGLVPRFQPPERLAG